MAGRKGRSGARRKPGHIHLVDGTHRPDRHGDAVDAETEAIRLRQEGVPAAPRSLSPSARSEWLRLAPILGPELLLTRRARGAFVAYCEAWADFVNAGRAVTVNLDQARGLLKPEVSARELAIAQQIVASGGRLARNRFGELVQHPAVRIAAQARRQVREFSVEYGLTPFSQSRINQANEDGTGRRPRPPAGRGRGLRAFNRLGKPI